MEVSDPVYTGQLLQAANIDPGGKEGQEKNLHTYHKFW